MNRAVLYARSSKDRHDVSIEAQLRQLQALAAERNLVVVKIFSDSVERADDLDRPGLRGLLHELKSSGRAWDVVIMLDTARLARQDQGFAFVFDRECEKRGVRVIYKMLPETHPVMDLVFRQMVRAWDMLQSLMSRERGLAGMAENVRQGHRAGGRAPFGFRLVHTPTGATRDGAPVTKSRLEPNDDAPRIAAYLRDRAAGVPRLRAREGAALRELADTTLIGVEWNAPRTPASPSGMCTPSARAAPTWAGRSGDRARSG
jgi:DNA invertase Pin-like site-specific DNA recombinase